MAVLRPLKLVIENWPEGKTETLEAINNPEDPSAGTRPITFGREIYIERDDFMEDPPKKFFRLAPGREVRLRYGYFVTCREAVKNAAGEVVGAALHVRSGDTRRQLSAGWAEGAGDAALGRRGGCGPAEVRLYNHLFARPDPGADGDIMADINPDFAGGAERLSAGTGVGVGADRRGGAVRAARVFLRGSGFGTGAAGVQPHGRAARHLGEGTKKGSITECSSAPRCSSPTPR